MHPNYASGRGREAEAVQSIIIKFRLQMDRRAVLGRKHLHRVSTHSPTTKIKTISRLSRPNVPKNQVFFVWRILRPEGQEMMYLPESPPHGGGRRGKFCFLAFLIGWKMAISVTICDHFLEIYENPYLSKGVLIFLTV